MTRPAPPGPIRTRPVLMGALGLLLAGSLALSACTTPQDAPIGSPATGAPRAVTTGTVEATPSPPAGRIAAPGRGAYLGVYTPPAPFEPRRIGDYETRIGKDVAIVMWYQPWEKGNRSLLDSGTIVAVWRRGKVPLITWEPWNPGTDAHALKRPSAQPAYRLKAIVSGGYDPYIRSWARQIADLGGPVMLRPMHEMNGNWYPWCGTVNGNKPAEYVAAWRRIHRIFAEEGAVNVTWVWSINHESVPGSDENRYAAYYPGDAYVDWTAISGFNFGTTTPYSSWQSFMHWYEKPLAYLATVGKPICIAEVGCVEQGGDKAAWIRDAFAQVARNRRIKAIVYYDAVESDTGSRQDWRVGSSRRSIVSFRAAAEGSHFLSGPAPELTAWVDTLKPLDWRRLVAIPPLY